MGERGGGQPAVKAQNTTSFTVQTNTFFVLQIAHKVAICKCKILGNIAVLYNAIYTDAKFSVQHKTYQEINYYVLCLMSYPKSSVL